VLPLLVVVVYRHHPLPLRQAVQHLRLMLHLGGCSFNAIHDLGHKSLTIAVHHVLTSLFVLMSRIFWYFAANSLPSSLRLTR
jgi:hypothetical protein